MDDHDIGKLWEKLNVLHIDLIEVKTNQKWVMETVTKNEALLVKIDESGCRKAGAHEQTELDVKAIKNDITSFKLDRARIAAVVVAAGFVGSVVATLVELWLTAKGAKI